ncbi:MAG: pinensin family lanthipeptide [Bacteroidota bacterium]
MEKLKNPRRKSKLQLEELRVQSFVTELKPELAQIAKGVYWKPSGNSIT